MSINIINASNTHNTTAKSNRSLSWIVFHYTAGTSSKKGVARACANMFATMSGQASADFIVDDEEIVQYNPDLKNRYCWHCGDGSSGTYGGQCYNSNSIGIEVCSTNSTGKITAANDQYFSFTDAALAKAKELIEYLMKTYNIPVSHVIRHYDVSTKWCPGVRTWIPVGGYSDTSWTKFKASLNASNASTATTTTTNTTTTTTTTTKATTTTSTSTSSKYVASNVQKWKNGSTTEYVYAEPALKTKIGSLSPYEGCYCSGVNDGAYRVAYVVDGTDGILKSGFVKYAGGCSF